MNLSPPIFQRSKQSATGLRSNQNNIKDIKFGLEPEWFSIRDNGLAQFSLVYKHDGEAIYHICKLVNPSPKAVKLGRQRQSAQQHLVGAAQQVFQANNSQSAHDQPNNGQQRQACFFYYSMTWPNYFVICYLFQSLYSSYHLHVLSMYSLSHASCLVYYLGYSLFTNFMLLDLNLYLY